MSAAQRQAALERANSVRLARAGVRKSLKAGDLTLADALEDPVARDMSVWQLVNAMPHWGEYRAHEAAVRLARRRADIHFGKRVRALTVRQRLALLDVVREMSTATDATRKREARRQRGKLIPANAAVVAVTAPPPRCGRCKTRLQDAAPDGLCGFCVEELELTPA